MFIRIVEATWDTEHCFVTFECHVGRAKAHWNNWGGGPLVGRDYCIEMDVHEPIDRKINAKDGRPGTRALSVVDDTVIVEADIEQIDDDGLACFRLAPDCIFAADLVGDFKVGEALRITFPYGSLSVTPIGF
jgi:hypothetical protein